MTNLHLQLGILSNNDASFRAICTLLASNRAYAKMPFSRAVDILYAVQRKQTFGVLNGDRLVGVVLWNEFSEETARRAIEERRMPARNESQASGPAVAANALVAESQAIVFKLWGAFVKAHRGRVIIYERHRPGNAVPSLFKWFDKSGHTMGTEL